MFINRKLKEINLKIVYYGPPLSGKTTNLEYIYQTIPPTRRGEMVSLKTRGDRTLFFDYLQMELPLFRGLHPNLTYTQYRGRSLTQQRANWYCKGLMASCLL